MRISGLASGMDINSIVKDMMKAQRVPLDKLKQQKQTLEWQRDDYRAINSQLLTFRNSLLDMKLTTAYRARTVSSSDDSKVSATATSNASLTSSNISSVTELARAEVRLSTGSINDGDIDSNKSLVEQIGDFKWSTGAIITTSKIGDGKEDTFQIVDSSNIQEGNLKDWSVKVDGKTYKVVTENAKLTDSTVLVNSDGTIKFNQPIKAGSNIQVSYIGKNTTETLTVGESLDKWTLSQKGIEKADKIVIKGMNGEEVQSLEYTIDPDGNIKNEKDDTIGFLNKTTGVITFDSDKEVVKSNKDITYTMELSYSHKYATFSMESTTSKGEQYENFIITGKDTLNNVINKVNSSKLGVSMFYDSGSGKMSLSRNETGVFNKDKSSEMWSNMDPDAPNFLKEVLHFDFTKDPETSAANAVFVINGLETNRTSNTFEMNGVTFTLKKKFTEVDSPVTINTSNNSDKVYENITNFIKRYNELIDKIQGKLDEKRNRSYSPLTDEQKESLSDKQQEKWEEIAKTGLLRNDSTLSNILSNMRTDFYATVQNSEISSAYNQLSKIGITTSSDYLSGGKLEINEAKLKKALEENPESVEQLFRGDNGIMSRLTTSLTKGMDAVKLKAGNDSSTNQTFTIGRELDNLDKRVDTFEDRMKDLEDRYYRQFTAMEQAIQKANSQSNYLYSFFSNGN